MQLPLIAEQGEGYSSPLNATRTVNLYPVMDKGGKQKVALFGTPGCEEWLSVAPGEPLGGNSQWSPPVSFATGVFDQDDARFTGGVGIGATRADAGRNSGKLYFEVVSNPVTGVGVGIVDGSRDLTASFASYDLAAAGNTWMMVNSGNAYSGVEADTGGHTASVSNPDVVGIAIDFAAQKMFVARDGVFAGDPVAGTGAIYTAVTGAVVHPFACANGAGRATIRLRDDEFAYAIPSGYSAWGTSADPGIAVPDLIRGCLELNGVGYFVSGNVFFSVSTGGVATQRGLIDTGTNPVNVETNGQQVAVCDGSSLWIYDITTESFAQITDPDFPGAGSFAVLDGYGLFNKPGTGQFYITSLLDFTNVDALDFATAESSPDDLIRVFVNGGTAWMMGKKTIEPWQNDGGELFPFSRVGNVRIQRGLAAVHAVCEAGGSPEFLGDDRIVYRLGGYSPEPVSNEGVEFHLSRMSRVDDCIAYSYTQEGHVFACFKFPGEGTTWVRDLGTGLWHERKTDDASWRANCMMKLGNRQLIGDDSTPRLLEIRTDLYADDGDEMVAEHVFPAVADGRGKIPHHRFELEVESGVGSLTGSDPSVVLDWSDDGGRTWSNFLTRKMGKVGEYLSRAIWNRLGSSRQRNYRIRISDPVKRVIISADVNGQDTGK